MIIVTFFEIETCRPSQAQTWPRHTLVHIEMPSITSNNRAPAKRLAAILVTTWGFTWQGCRLLKILRPLELENNKVQGLTNNRKSPVHPKWLVSKHLRQNNAKHDSHQSKSFQAQQKKKHVHCLMQIHLETNMFALTSLRFVKVWKRPRTSQILHNFSPVQLMVNRDM